MKGVRAGSDVEGVWGFPDLFLVPYPSLAVVHDHAGLLTGPAHRDRAAHVEALGSGKVHVTENVRRISTAVPKSTRVIIIVDVAFCSGLDICFNCNLPMNLMLRSRYTYGICS